MSTFDSGTGALLTDEMVEKMRRNINRERPITRQWHTQATRDAITHWAEGIGDLNPLWLSEEYARGSRYGCLVAPPTFLYSCNQGPAHRYPGLGHTPSRGTGLPGIHKIWTGDSWEWFQPLLIGDEISATQRLEDLMEKTGEFAGRMYEQHRVDTFKNQRGEVIAIHTDTFIAAERSTASTKGKYSDLTKYRYTEAELKAITEDVYKEVVRGATPRYWDDTQVGEDITPVVKGPLTLTEMIAFLQAWGGPFMMASEIRHLYLQDHPAANCPDPETGVADFPERAHWDDAFARQCGLPAGYDIGGERVSWMGHMMTNWMGDDGFLKKLRARFIGLNIIGDTTWFRGTVTRKYVEGNQHLVDCELDGTNQRGTKTTLGWATVMLPYKGSTL